jgi:hypothetical protein
LPLFRQFILNQQSANLFNLVWLGKGTSWLQVENLVNPFSREYVVTALDSLREAEPFSEALEDRQIERRHPTNPAIFE